MRTTVTLDPDTERLLREAMHLTGHNFKVTLNEAVRVGLTHLMPPAPEKPFVVEAQDMGLRPGIDIANIHDFEAELEVAAYLDVTRKLQDQAGNATSAERSKS
jgi:hypothetical protein